MPISDGMSAVLKVSLGTTPVRRVSLGETQLWGVADVAAPTRSSSGPTSVTIRWAEPADYGLAITDYDVRYRVRNSGAWTSRAHTGTARTTTIRGLTPVVTYEFQVRATNSAGAGDWSPSLFWTTAAAQPSRPAAPTLTSRAVNQLVIGWVAPAANGAAITDYDVQYREQGTQSWTSHAHNGTGTSATITGLNGATTYEVQVRAENSAGESAWSPSLTATTPSVPSAVTNLRWTSRPGRNRGGTVEWDVPDDDGGSPVLHYRVRTWTYSTAHGNVVENLRDYTTTTRTATSAGHFASRSGVAVQVWAVNEVGASPVAGLSDERD